MKRKKKTDRQKLVLALDTIVSKIVRQKYGYCVVCGSTENLTNGHVFTRTNYSTRWDVDDAGNCHCQCMGCNLRHEHDPYKYYKWFIDKWGQQALDDLHIRFTGVSRFKDWQLEELLEKLTIQYNGMEIKKPWE